MANDEGVTSRIASVAEQIKEKAASALGQGSHALHETMEKFDLGNLGPEAMKGLADEVNDLTPTIKQAGYQVEGIDLVASINPKVYIRCRMEIDISPEERTKLEESLAHKKISSTVVRALFRVSDAQKKFQFGTMRPSGVVLELGLSPSVTVLYREPAN
ncbi:MAG TPA: hypothetical protein VKF80_06675 [Candidatus Eisenbacteria bacterium]|nr:hypothetical protein [Candidatus Eisenbacteria bacterium]